MLYGLALRRPFQPLQPWRPICVMPLAVGRLLAPALWNSRLCRGIGSRRAPTLGARCSLTRLLPSRCVARRCRTSIVSIAFARHRRLDILPRPFRNTRAPPSVATATIPGTRTPEVLLLLLRGVLHSPRSRSFPLDGRAPTPPVRSIGWARGGGPGLQVASWLCRGTTWMAVHRSGSRRQQVHVCQAWGQALGVSTFPAGSQAERHRPPGFRRGG